MSDDLCKALREVLEFQSAPEGPTIHDWGRWRRVLDAALAQPSPQAAPTVPEGFKLVAVKGFDDLMYWLDRCERKGHLENCYDLIEPWAAFEYRDAAPQEPQR